LGSLQRAIYLGGVALMYYGELQTRNFTFRTFAYSEIDARAQLEKAWNKHALETLASLEWEELEDAVAVFFFRQGDTWRDFEPFISYDTPNNY
jgi:hypothetical protein